MPGGISEDAVWTAVADVWPGLEALRAGGFDAAPAIIVETLRTGRTLHSAAIQLVLSAVTHHVQQSVPPERRQQILGDLKQILTSGFEKAQGAPVDPITQKTVVAWQTIRGWADDGRTEQEMPALFLRQMVRALTH